MKKDKDEEFISTLINNNLTRIAHCMEEILRLVKEDQERSKNIWRREKMSKYNYTYEEYSQDTRSYTVESDVKLTREEIQDMALSCSMVEGATYKSKNSIATFKGTEFGDDSQTEFGGDETKEEQSE